MEIEKIMVVGAGIMGAGIAQSAAQAGLEVFMSDLNENIVQQGLARIRHDLQGRVAKGKLVPGQVEPIMARITPVTELEPAATVELVLEAVVEVMAVKKEVFQRLDGICPAATILATNTSGLSITEIASVTRRPQRVIGLHFFNPVPAMQLVEVIRGFLTSEETCAVGKQFARQLGKTPIEVKEAPGFAVNRILCPMINEAIFAYAEGVASAEDIDQAMALGANHPMGPLALADLVGLDTLLHVLEGLHREFADDKYRPAPLLRTMVRAGLLGRKSGRGFYQYE